jgi:hypothetical protein
MDTVETFSVWGVIRQTFAIIGRGLPTLLGLAMLAFVIPFIAAESLWFACMRAWGAGSADAREWGQLGVLLMVFVLHLVLCAILVGAVAHAVLDSLHGARPAIGRSLRTGLRRFVPIVWISLCYGLCYLLLLVLVFMPIGILELIAKGSGSAVADSTPVGMAWTGLQAVICAGLLAIVLRGWIAAWPASIDEKIVFSKALERSDALTAGMRWTTFTVIFGYQVTLSVISIAGRGLPPFQPIVGNFQSPWSLSQFLTGSSVIMFWAVEIVVAAVGTTVIYRQLLALKPAPAVEPAGGQSLASGLA